jgi:tetratricopeptide (TPR) repeat protein
MRLCGWLGASVAALLLVACGGSNASSQAAGARSPANTASAKANGDSGAASAPDTASSPDLLAGIKAFDAGSYSDARRSFEAASKANPADFQAYYDLGMTCEKLGDKAAAEAAYKSALVAKPNFDVAAVALGSLELDAGRTDDALAVTRAGLARNPGSAVLHENLGVTLAMRGDSEGATAELEQAIKLAPAEPMFQLTLAHWLNAWHAGGAGPHLASALGMVKDDIGMLASIGFEYRMAGNFALCIRTFDRAIAIRDGGEVRTERGICKLGKQDDEGAFDDLEAAVAKEPTYAAAHYWLAGRLALRKRYREAAAEYAKYLELQPNGSLAKPAAERRKAAQDLASRKKDPGN